MYFYKNGQKHKYKTGNGIPIEKFDGKENFQHIEKYGNNNRKCPTWILILLTVLSFLITSYLIYRVIKRIQ